MSSDDRVFQEVNALLGALAVTTDQLDLVQNEMNRRIDAIKQEHAPDIDRYTKRRDRLVEIIAAKYIEHREELTRGKGKEVPLRNGILSVRTTSKVVADDEASVIKRIVRAGMVRVALIRTVKYTINRSWFLRNPDRVAKIKGLQIVKSENLTIKLTAAQGTVIRDDKPLSIRLSNG